MLVSLCFTYRYKALAPMYYRGASVVLLVFDLVKRESLAGVKYWMDELKQSGPDNAIFVLVGNKLDLAESGRQVTGLEGLRHAKEINAFYCETSAKTGENVVQLFEDVCVLLEDRTPKRAMAIPGASERRDRQMTVNGVTDYVPPPDEQPHRRWRCCFT